ncbi:MAG: transketolase [Candidatus Andersenbacteria bacterium RIFCSPHIGHO2_12_FULL_46_9]|nr:MAG: Transketolase domain protein [Parcubacteria group bacterium GW2011_GWA2_45_14]OGY33836.1 MAG: transketolase [Candidatus Andersenbacteria bacterium RIFCSPHIGHO2_02_FULL_46_16]OGY36271.1 MAG: transketolase [Candidatus Andersenbacteria bacterium RIFCSPLOWO2_02_FULL_46_11]OGY37077.1 MAG: transketolase [Candidatus Andersenbacteria bacterium RIFCSPHIGHO2_12_FULL_46_9]OGY42353.1 MAG: transketolase [Candidatus Andersenbacteria bacterium RIFCSPLOWO2_12_FULL_45_8]HBE89925.1 transketolase [Candid
MDVKHLEEKARGLRKQVIEMLYAAQSGHPGSSLSGMDLLVTLFFSGLLRHDPVKSDMENRDYFILSNGHACPALYAVLAERGYFPKAELKKLRQLGAGAQGHPHRGSLPGVEISSGSLGQGLSVGLGLALASKLRKNDKRSVYVMMSDGEQEEGSTWEAVMYAPKEKLDNLVALVDKNGMQIDGFTKKVMPTLDPLAAKYRAFGWQVQEIDGHNLKAIWKALVKAQRIKKPAVIIAHTVRGKGVSFMENSEHWHAGAITLEQYEMAMEELGS